jgi:hypothetical protein
VHLMGLDGDLSVVWRLIMLYRDKVYTCPSQQRNLAACCV